MQASTMVSIFQWVGAIGALFAFISFIGVWHFSEKVEVEKRTQIEELKKSNDTILKFQEVAKLDLNGSPYLTSRGISYTTPLTRALEGTFVIHDNRLQFKDDERTLQQLKGITQSFPNFPFAYYGVAYILKKRENNAWRQYAEKAVTILERTTTIPEHNRNHDRVLGELKEKLSVPS